MTAEAAPDERWSCKPRLHGVGTGGQSCDIHGRQGLEPADRDAVTVTAMCWNQPTTIL